MEEPEKLYEGMSPLTDEEKHRILEEEYFSEIHKWGRRTSLIHAFILFLPVIYLAIFYDLIPPMDVALKAFVGIASIAMPFWFIEPVSYFFILGVAGTYIAFLGGNISNLRVPVATVAQEVAGVQEGSPEGEIIAGLGILASQWVLSIVTLIGALFLITLIDGLPFGAQLALSNYVLPAFWGALVGQFAVRNMRYSLIAFISAIIVCWLIVPGYGWLEVPILVVLMTLVTLISNRMEKRRKS